MTEKTPGQVGCETFWAHVAAGPDAQEPDAAWRWAESQRTRDAWEAAVDAVAGPLRERIAAVEAERDEYAAGRDRIIADWQDAERRVTEATAKNERLTATRDRAMDALAAVKDALGWDDSRWVEWLASSSLPIPWELACTVTMIGQGPDLARDVRALADERDEMRRRAADLNADFIKFNGVNTDLADALTKASTELERLKTGITAFLGDCEDGVADLSALRKLVSPGE